MTPGTDLPAGRYWGNSSSNFPSWLPTRYVSLSTRSGTYRSCHLSAYGLPFTSSKSCLNRCTPRCGRSSTCFRRSPSWCRTCSNGYSSWYHNLFVLSFVSSNRYPSCCDDLSNPSSVCLTR